MAFSSSLSLTTLPSLAEENNYSTLEEHCSKLHTNSLFGTSIDTGINSIDAPYNPLVPSKDIGTNSAKQPPYPRFPLQSAQQ